MVKRFYEETSKDRSKRVNEYLNNQCRSKKHNFLIIGTGLIGREHIRVASLLGAAKIHGIYDTNKKSMDLAEEELQKYSNEKLIRYNSLKSAYQDPAIDAILICTPNYTHHQMFLEVAKSGKPIFVEKPMATSLKDGAEILRLSSKHPAFIQVGMQYRYKAQYVDAFHEVKILKSLGSIKTISMSEYRPPFLDKVEQWNKFNEFSGGTFVEKCCHYFDLINLLADGPPRDVFASGGQAVNFLNFVHEGRKSDIDDHGFAIINYRNGIRANFTLNMFASEFYEELVITGEKGRLVASEKASADKTRQTKASIMVEVEGHQHYEGSKIGYPPSIEKSGHHGATFFEHEALISQLQQNEVDAATPRQGLMAMLVASAAQRSISENNVVSIVEHAERNGIKEILNQ